jgi:hypothetical protein
VSKDDRGVIADWVVLLSGVLLFASLFLAWSRLSPAYVAVADRLQTLQGVPPDPTAWQVYSAADVVLAVLAASLAVIALVGNKRGQIGAMVAALLALAFAIHAVGAAPTNGAPDALRASADVTQYVAPAPDPGAGETLAIIALVSAIAGLGVSLVSD